MKPLYKTAIFRSYDNGFFRFTMQNGVDMVFEEVHPHVLMKLDLQNDKSLLNRTFHLGYTEDITDDEDDFIIYRIEYLELINSN